jgi:hypothetical protein
MNIRLADMDNKEEWLRCECRFNLTGYCHDFSFREEKKHTISFGALEQGPNEKEKSREDTEQYSVGKSWKIIASKMGCQFAVIAYW